MRALAAACAAAVAATTAAQVPCDQLNATRLKLLTFDVFAALMDLPTSLQTCASTLLPTAPASNVTAMVQRWIGEYGAAGDRVFGPANTTDGLEPFPFVIRAGLNTSLAAAGLVEQVPYDSPLYNTLCTCWGNLIPWPGAVEALQTLSQAGYKLAPLSNGDRPTLVNATRAFPGVPFAYYFSSDRPVGAFKPQPAMYAQANATVASPDEILHIAGGASDATGARTFGILAGQNKQGGGGASSSACIVLNNLTELVGILNISSGNATGSPTPVASPSATASASASGSASASASAVSSSSASGSAVATATATLSPGASASGTSTASAVPSATATGTATSSASPTPGNADGAGLGNRGDSQGAGNTIAGLFGGIFLCALAVAVWNWRRAAVKGHNAAWSTSSGGSSSGGAGAGAGAGAGSPSQPQPGRPAGAVEDWSRATVTMSPLQGRTPQGLGAAAGTAGAYPTTPTSFGPLPVNTYASTQYAAGVMYSVPTAGPGQATTFAAPGTPGQQQYVYAAYPGAGAGAVAVPVAAQQQQGAAVPVGATAVGGAVYGMPTQQGPFSSA